MYHGIIKPGKYQFLPKRRMEPRRSSHKRNIDDFLSIDMAELEHSPPMQKTEDALRRLWSIRDFLSLISSYHMEGWDSRIATEWIEEATLAYDFASGREMEDILSASPLKHLESLIPSDIIEDVEHGRRFLFKDHEAATSQGKSEQHLLTSSPSNTREGKQVLQLNEVDSVIPQSILNLAADLAVQQLIQYFPPTSGEWKSLKVMLSTRNEDEMLAVKGKIEEAVKMKGTQVLWIDASKYQVDKELRVTQEISQHLKSITGEAMFHNDIVVIVVDGNGENKQNLGHEHFSYREITVRYFMALLSTESATDEYDKSRMELDLEIRTEDHLLPWLLFSRNVGCELLYSSSAIQNIAVEIVEECRDHLLAIVLVAKSLKNVTDLEHWKLALKKLRDSGGIRQAVRNIIYEDLNTVQQQCLRRYLFLSGAKEKVVPVKFLLFDWVDSGLLYPPEEAENVLQQLLDRSLVIPEGTDVRLLMGTRHILESLTGYDKMKGMSGKLTFTDSEDWEKIEKLLNLPEWPHFPDIQSLSLQHNADLTEIPSLLFEKMFQLTFVDLSYTSITELPNSFFNLRWLQSLDMRGCELFTELPPEIKRLKKLKVLDLADTQITQLPEEFQELTNLEKLNLSFCGYGQSTGPIIPSGVISKLTNLVDLRIDINPDDKRWDQNIEDILPEFRALRLLTTLTLYLPRALLLEHLPNRKNFDFRYTIGDHDKRLISREPSVVTRKFEESGFKLRFVNGKDVPKEINTILSRTDAFFLDRHVSIKSLSEFNVKDVMVMSTCIIVGECNEMEVLVDGNSPNKNHLLIYAEFLSVYYMKNLESIWRGPALSISCFRRLEYLAFHTCPKLTTIFTLDFLDDLPALEDLVVEDCSSVTTLISHESSSVRVEHFLPRLKRLLLVYLPELVSISSGLLIGEGVEKMGFYYCPKLQSLSQEELSSQKLEIIKGETKWWDELNWNHWGPAGRPKKFDDIFSPINEEAHVMSQLIEEIIPAHLAPMKKSIAPNDHRRHSFEVEDDRSAGFEVEDECQL